MTDAKEKRGRGRPATGQTPKRYFRMDDESWESIKKASGLSDGNISDYIRRVLLRDAARVLKKQSGR